MRNPHQPRVFHELASAWRERTYDAAAGASHEPLELLAVATRQAIARARREVRPDESEDRAGTLVRRAPGIIEMDVWRRHWRGPRDLRDISVRVRRGGPHTSRRTGERVWGQARPDLGACDVWAGQCDEDNVTLLLHELAHLGTPIGEDHGPRWRTVSTLAFCEALELGHLALPEAEAEFVDLLVFRAMSNDPGRDLTPDDVRRWAARRATLVDPGLPS